jgi:hypothetical protein
MPLRTFHYPAPVFALLLSMAACDFGDISTYDLPQPAAVSVTLLVRAEEPGLAAALGWPAGIPAAEVEITAAAGESGWSWRGESDASGTVRVADVPAGTYRVAVRRVLNESERARLDGAVNAFIDERVLLLDAAADYALDVPAARTRGLVISEFFFRGLQVPGAICCYYFGGFLRIHNNADSTAYLDGMILGQGFNFFADFTPPRSCADLQHMRLDPEGIWSMFFHKFPGTGRDYPVLPGRSVIVATDAIDHRPFGAHDLSGADFEFVGPSGGVDNPAVPNLVDIGTQPHPLGHGLYFNASTIFFLAAAQDDTKLLRMREPGNPYEYARIPFNTILDSGIVVGDQEAAGTLALPRCAARAHSKTDRGYAVNLRFDQPHLSLHRRPLLTAPDGRTILQHTGNSGVDFFTGPVSVAQSPRD